MLKNKRWHKNKVSALQRYLQNLVARNSFPCPWCGDEGEHNINLFVNGDGNRVAIYKCFKCGAMITEGADGNRD